MTRDEIMALEGRELDKAVAVHVMGVPADSVDWAVSHDGYMRDYSSNIAAAWRVVEHIEQPIVLTNVAVGKWDCTVMMFETDEDDITVQCDTAPEAICKAALLAVKAGASDE